VDVRDSDASLSDAIHLPIDPISSVDQGNNVDWFEASANHAPVMAYIPPQSVTIGQTLNVSVTAIDPDGTTPSLTAAFIPANASFLDNGNGTGAFDFTPNAAQVGVHIVFFIVSDGVLADTAVVTITADLVNDIEDDNHRDVLPSHVELSQNYPNPFNPVTTIEYSIPRRCNVRLDIYNSLGRKVRTLIDQEEWAGSHLTTWDGTSRFGETVSTGVYFYRLQAGDSVEMKKMLLVR